MFLRDQRSCFARVCESHCTFAGVLVELYTLRCFSAMSSSSATTHQPAGPAAGPPHSANSVRRSETYPPTVKSTISAFRRGDRRNTAGPRVAFDQPAKDDAEEEDVIEPLKKRVGTEGSSASNQSDGSSVWPDAWVNQYVLSFG